MKSRVVAAFWVILVLGGFALPRLGDGAEAPIKIGAIFSVTGKASWLGESQKNTVMMMVEKTNLAGGVKRRPIEIIVEDDETSPDKALSAAQKLIDKDKVLAIIGPSTSGSSLKVKPVCQKAGIPMVSCAAAEAIITPIAESTFIFKTPQLDSHVAEMILEQIKRMGMTKVAIITELSPFGDLGKTQLSNHAKDMGIQIVAAEAYGPSDTNLGPQLQKIGASGAEALVNWAIIPVQVLIPKTMRSLGMKIPLFQSHGFGNPNIINETGDAAEGTMICAGRLLIVNSLPQKHPQKKALWNYKYDYERKYGPPVTTFGGHAYDALSLVVGAVRREDITPAMNLAQARKVIRSGIERTSDWVGTAGPVNMSPTDHSGLEKNASLEMLYVEKGGKIIPLSDKPK
jgi:branched-chain amino acid transport system substrate-binding protein